MHCWNCGALLSLPGKLSFRASCDHCHASLHCCRNCVYYKPGLPNDCMVPGTDFVPDRESNNFCEEFKMLGKAPEEKIDPKQIERRLFGEEPSQNDQRNDDPKNRFNGLFE